MIFDVFIARIYFIIFRMEFPRLSVAAKNMIDKFGHRYFKETSTYIRVFGAIGAPHLLLFMSRIISYWDRFVTRLFYKVIMLP
jgi:hypothetical protein